MKNWLGDLSYNDQNQVVGAKAAKMLYVISSTSGDEMNTKIVVSSLSPARLMEKHLFSMMIYHRDMCLSSVESVPLGMMTAFRETD